MADEVILNGRVSAGTERIDGCEHVALAVEHPRHGLIIAVLSADRARSLVKQLNDAIARATEIPERADQDAPPRGFKPGRLP